MPRYIYGIGMIFLLLLSMGIFLANNILIFLSMIPLTFMAVGYYIKAPHGVVIKKTISRNRVSSGELLDVSVNIRVESGIGVIEISDLVPHHFELVSGSNFCVLWKGSEPEMRVLNYTVKCISSGKYLLKSTVWKARHPICNYSIDGICQNAISLEVSPRLLGFKKIRAMSGASSLPLPEGALATLGMTTQEFKELRTYCPGDSFKSINWKVTSRNLLRGEVWPIVNEFEKEGKKSVWIFLDTSGLMSFGPNVADIKEYSIEAAYALSEYYLGKNCSVSLHTYGGNGIFIRPSSGKQQQYRILRELIRIKYRKPATSRYTAAVRDLEENVHARRGYFISTRPLFLIVTRFCTNNSDEILRGISEMTKYTTMRRGCLPSIMLINIMGYRLMAENQHEMQASDILEAMNKIISKKVRNKCVWIDWDPTKGSLTGALLKGVRVSI